MPDPKPEPVPGAEVLPLRERAVLACLELLESDGVDALSMRGVARRLGVTHRAVAKHFDGGLSGLLAAAGAEIYCRLERCFDASAATDPEVPGAFRAMGRVYIGFARDHPSWIRLLVSPVLVASEDEALHTTQRLFFDRMHEAVRQGQRQGMIRLGPPVDVAVFAWTAVQGFALLEAQIARLSPRTAEQRASEFLDSVFLGIRPLGKSRWWPDSVRRNASVRVDESDDA